MHIQVTTRSLMNVVYQNKHQTHTLEETAERNISEVYEGTGTSHNLHKTRVGVFG